MPKTDADMGETSADNSDQSPLKMPVRVRVRAAMALLICVAFATSRRIVAPFARPPASGACAFIGPSRFAPLAEFHNCY